MTQASNKILIALDIDETQIPERSHPKYDEGEQEAILTLKTTLEDLADQSRALILHVSNGMLFLYEQVASQLALPDYVSGNASTQLHRYNKGTGALELDQTYHNVLLQSGYNKSAALDYGERRSTYLTPSGLEHQTPLKTSFLFNAGIPLGTRKRIFEDLQELVRERHPGIEVFYVEGSEDPDGPRTTIDFLPAECTKGRLVEFVARQENISLENILVAGNGDNDISMFRSEFMTVAVSGAQESLKKHVHALQATSPQGKNQHLIAPENRAKGILYALNHFGIR